MLILFSCQFDEKFTSKTDLASCYLKLSLPAFLKCFLIVPNSSITFLIYMFLIKNRILYGTLIETAGDGSGTSKQDSLMQGTKAQQIMPSRPNTLHIII